METQSNIAILSTVINFGLYERTSPLFPAGMPRFVIDGRNGMHAFESLAFMFRKLKGRGIEWLIMADEDVVFLRPERVAGLISYMKENDLSVCGVRDGGIIPHRTRNPHAINTFFSVLNFAEIEAIWDENEVRKHQRIGTDEFGDDLSNVNGQFDRMSLYEPYYCFYFWLRRNGKKILFLDADVPFADDEISNRVFDQDGAELLYHTWYARSYGNNEKHTRRIDRVLALAPFAGSDRVLPVIFKDPTFAARHYVQKQWNRILSKAGIKAGKNG